MAISAICMHCLKTISIEPIGQTVCPDCGRPLNTAELKKNGLVIDAAREASEFALAKDCFKNTEFLSASEHFRKALDANKNSYLSQYFIRLCDIYLNESLPKFDIMRSAVDAVVSSLDLVSRSGVSVNDKLNFVVAMLTEIRIIILNRLNSGDEKYETDIKAYRAEKLKDLGTLLELFKIDGELLMTFSPNVKTILFEIADRAIAVCHKTIQSVIIGEELFVPSENDIKKLQSLCNDYCFFATSFSADYDVKKYTPDFTQNDLLNEKVKSRFEKFDAKNKSNARKFIVDDVKEYNAILSECDKALTFTYYNCFVSMCDPKLEKRGDLIKEGLLFLYRIFTPRIVIGDKKRVEIHIDKFVNLYDKFGMFSKFLDDAELFGKYGSESFKMFFARLHGIIDLYFTDIYDKHTKIIDRLKQTRGEDFEYYEKILLNTAVACACALNEFVPYSKEKDKNRARLVKICKLATDEFLMLRDYNISELEQSNIYRPILDISNAVLKELD